MDNLFNSVKLYSTLYRADALAHGVARTNGRGVPAAIIQKEEKNKDRAEKLRGTTKAARLDNLPGCPGMLAVSTYDTKPVHILSTAAESVEWVAKERKVWDANENKKSLIKFLRLNVIEDYNNNMNRTDIADQLSGCLPTGSLDAEQHMVVGVFYMGDWSCRCKCLQNIRCSLG